MLHFIIVLYPIIVCPIVADIIIVKFLVGRGGGGIPVHPSSLLNSLRRETLRNLSHEPLIAPPYPLVVLIVTTK